MSDATVERLLVYGLLRRNMSMGTLMRGAQFIGERRVSGFAMYDLGNYPGAVPGEGELVAELYALADPQILDELDRAEGVFDDPPLYRRVQVELEDGPAWIYQYLQQVDPCQLIPSGDWTRRLN